MKFSKQLRACFSRTRRAVALCEGGPRIPLILGLAVVAVAPAFGQALTGTSLNVNSAGASTLTGTLTVSGASTFNNNLTITGWTDLLNNQFTLGASGTVFSNWLFTDNATDTLANVLNRGSASWLWAHGTTGAPVPAMRLDSNHQLLLFKMPPAPPPASR